MQYLIMIIMRNTSEFLYLPVCFITTKTLKWEKKLYKEIILCTCFYENFPNFYADLSCF